MTWVDYAVLGIVVLSMLMGLFTGFIRGVFALAGWIAALILAAEFASSAAPWLSPNLLPPWARQLFAGAVIFVAVWLLAAILGWLLAKSIRSVGLGFIDRGLGVVFGLLRGVMIVIICAVLAGLSPLVRQQEWQDASFRGPLETAALAVKPYLPQAIADRMQF